MTHVSPDILAPNRLRILLADDHAVMRQALRVILESNADVEVIGEAADGSEAVSLAAALKPDIVIMDINMPRMDGVEATREIKNKRAEVIIIGLSVIENKDVMDAMKAAGAEEVLLKDASEQLHEAITVLVQRAR
jgi:DNA-binding NarL/FixJ family response regulator